MLTNEGSTARDEDPHVDRLNYFTIGLLCRVATVESSVRAISFYGVRCRRARWDLAALGLHAGAIPGHVVFATLPVVFAPEMIPVTSFATLHFSIFSSARPALESAMASRASPYYYPQLITRSDAVTNIHSRPSIDVSCTVFAVPSTILQRKYRQNLACHKP